MAQFWRVFWPFVQARPAARGGSAGNPCAVVQRPERLPRRGGRGPVRPPLLAALDGRLRVRAAWIRPSRSPTAPSWCCARRLRARSATPGSALRRRPARGAGVRRRVRPDPTRGPTTNGSSTSRWRGRPPQQLAARQGVGGSERWWPATGTASSGCGRPSTRTGCRSCGAGGWPTTPRSSAWTWRTMRSRSPAPSVRAKVTSRLWRRVAATARKSGRPSHATARRSRPHRALGPGPRGRFRGLGPSPRRGWRAPAPGGTLRRGLRQVGGDPVPGARRRRR